MGYTLSDDPNTVPPDNDLLGGLLMVPEDLRPSKQMLSEILQHARADL